MLELGFQLVSPISNDDSTFVNIDEYEASKHNNNTANHYKYEKTREEHSQSLYYKEKDNHEKQRKHVFSRTVNFKYYSENKETTIIHYLNFDLKNNPMKPIVMISEHFYLLSIPIILLPLHH